MNRRSRQREPGRRPSGGSKGGSVDRSFVHSAERGAGITFAVVTLLLALAWFSFLRHGLALIQERQGTIGYAVIVASGLIYLGVWLRAQRARRWFLEDVRAGRIRPVPIRASALRDERGEEAFPEDADGRMGYERPRADDHLWWMLLLVMIVGGLMYVQPWNSPLLRALLEHPLLVLREGGAVTTQPPVSRRAHPVSPPPRREEVAQPADPAYRVLQERVRGEASPCPYLLQSAGTVLAWEEREHLDSALYQALLCKTRRTSYRELYWAPDRLALLRWGQPFPEEGLIARLRERLARLRQPPAGVTLREVPSTTQPPAIDGRIPPLDWRRALAIRLSGSADTLMLTADRDTLYLGLLVPEESRDYPGSRLRVVLHAELSQWIEEEWITLDGKGHVAPGCRTSALRAPDPPGEEPRYRKLTECGLYPHARGGSSVEGYRTYEVELDRREAGLPAGHPVPLALQLRIGAQEAPMLMLPRAGEDWTFSANPTTRTGVAAPRGRGLDPLAPAAVRWGRKAGAG